MTRVSLKRNLIEPVSFRPSDDWPQGEESFNDIFYHIKKRSPDTLFIRMASLWKRLFYSSGRRRRYFEEGEHSFSILCGRLRGVVLTIKCSNGIIYLSIKISQNNRNHVFLYHKKDYVFDKLKEIFPDEAIEFTIEYEN
ncbi:type III secretion system LEE needle length regulator EscP [Escherichia coli]|uniref:Orf16 n=3 Tax=Escherichia coli TaxID=562 RepID=O52142_ECOLX|nr:type III secretion system LEE needle length regulator EscP [Escherichia coli]AAC38385.1 Orf16 [Escherichia coli]EEU9373796.1 type III secretion system LEE needle length regulator EscP [Escherichia coli]EEX0487670.1 type III secretion system LEE needle length regulator EscP [Escherichia coli]EFA4418300.1 type III secretion system LEE needle length regulator EscP [Escherichia coli]EFE7420579.1 type III secretion system LEE needle length regulator EscP [Escherichia coli]